LKNFDHEVLMATEFIWSPRKGACHMFLESFCQGLIQNQMTHPFFSNNRKVSITIQWWGCVGWLLNSFSIAISHTFIVCHMVLKSLHQGLSKNIDAPFCCHPMVGVCQFVGHPFVPLNHAFNL
jgi:hypothetical protein